MFSEALHSLHGSVY